MARFEHYQDKGNEWRWRFTSSNGRVIAVSSEGYRNEADCLNGIRLLQSEGPSAPINRLETPKTH
ncbi:MAG: DUF1508 domain-containing protein [Candidatus Thermoplasmatota archaeon]